MNDSQFWAAVDRSGGANQCWPWTRALSATTHGYGIVARERGNERAHRVAWTLTCGPIPDGLLVCHQCDNPPCCNPAYLFLGTPSDNMRDAERKGRTRNWGSPGVTPVVYSGDRHWTRTQPHRIPRGSARAMAKLTEDGVRAIKADLRIGLQSRKAIARRFGVGAAAIDAIAWGETWKHVA